MDINVADYEKLGKFYLGRTYDIGQKEMLDELVMYDSKDLVTHGVVLGMTGSGKTGLCMALLEEAAMDGIPSIVIDPKGDIANMMLQFPDFQGSSFRPWVNEGDAKKKGLSPDEFAQKQADLWKNGLGQWGQSGERMESLKSKVDINVFTPGSSAGIPVSILSSLDVPEFEILGDGELLSERIESTVSSLLSLMGIDADPIQSPEHILLSNIFNHCWQNGESLTLQSMIRHIMQPPFTSVGVVDVEDFFSEKKRQALAMKMNNLLASPGFSTWLKGVPLDINKMMSAPDGRARVSIFSIAHLGDSERMFFVSLLLNQMLGWMRAQSGTSSLRALLYMDEIYGYLPPTANPPSKKPMMTMLKQARAFGLGVLLATQNPVDLDYKALSNIGTWFLGRLQTERDKARVLAGLEGAAASQDAGFDHQRMEEILAGLGSRVFLLNNVHEEAPVTFHVRWVMSYLRGPLARAQIKKLMDPKRSQFKIMTHETGASSHSKAGSAPSSGSTGKPAISTRIDEYFLPVAGEFLEDEITYMPAVIRSAQVRFAEAKYDVYGDREITLLNKVDDRQDRINWHDSFQLPNELNVSHLQQKPHNAKSFGPLSKELTDSTSYTRFKDDFEDWIYHNETMEVLKAEAFEMYSKSGETEGEFRGRLRHRSHELRDEAVNAMRDKYESKIIKLEDKISEQAAQAGSARMSAVVSIGSSVFGAIFGGRSRFSATKARTASSRASKAWKEGRDVTRAKQELERLEQELEREIARIEDQFDADLTPVEPVGITPLKKNIDVKACGLAWLPYVDGSRGELLEAWK